MTLPLNILGGLIFAGAACFGVYYGVKQIFSPSEVDVEKMINDSIKKEKELKRIEEK